MRLPTIEQKARSLNIKDTQRYNKPELIRLIQRTEGNTPCFGTTRKECVHVTCCWRNDCIRK